MKREEIVKLRAMLALGLSGIMNENFMRMFKLLAAEEGYENLFYVVLGVLSRIIMGKYSDEKLNNILDDATKQEFEQLAEVGRLFALSANDTDQIKMEGVEDVLDYLDEQEKEKEPSNLEKFFSMLGDKDQGQYVPDQGLNFKDIINKLKN